MSSDHRRFSSCRHRRIHPSTPKLANNLPDRDALLADLSRSLHLWPTEIDLDTRTGRCRIAAGLARALRVQRCRAAAGHWSYDIACHARLLALHRRVVKLQRTGCGERRRSC
ncbi:MAG: hypothetical protein ACR2PI_00880 [Hyphomicrobiaceae bacterium]